MKFAAFFVLALGASACVTTEEPPAPGTCAYVPVTTFVTDGEGAVESFVSTAEARGVTLQLGAPNREAAPDVWDGPLTLAQGDQRCTAKEDWVSLITKVFVSYDGRHVMLESYSGSSTSVLVVNARTCALEQQLSMSTGGIEYGRAALVAASACECGDVAAMECTCDGAKKWTIEPSCQLKLDEAASRALTREEVGVEFLGQAKVKRPNTREAALLTPASP